MDTPFVVEGIDHIALRVQDVEKSSAFYELFGRRLEVPATGPVRTPMAFGPTTRMVLFPEPSSESHHISLSLRTTHEIDEVLDFMRAHGAEPFKGPKIRDTGAIEYWFMDPDGNRLELLITQDRP